MTLDRSLQSYCPELEPSNASGERARALGTTASGKTAEGIIGRMAASTPTREQGSEGARERVSASESVAGPGAVATQKLHELEARLAQLGGLMVAYSGGVDSAFLAATAHRLLGERMLAVLADSPSLARRDMEQACAFRARWECPCRWLRPMSWSAKLRAQR